MKRVIVSFVVLILGCNLDDNSKMERKGSNKLIRESGSDRRGQENRALGR
ncbi:hypothetical protein [Borreliella burgdorferi]|nr:hypothetical protein [Borreliella burgdorferi]